MTRTIPMDEWGKDHWSTLAYIETRIVDHKGFIDNRHMRGRVAEYPTRLANGAIEPLHSDYDCAEDMIAEGLLEGGRLSWDEVMSYPQRDRVRHTHIYSLTTKGWKVAEALRAHKGDGGNYAGFTYEGEAVG